LDVPAFGCGQGAFNTSGEASALADGLEFVYTFGRVDGMVFFVRHDRVVESEGDAVDLELDATDCDTVAISGKDWKLGASFFDCGVQSEYHRAELLANRQSRTDTPDGAKVMLPKTGYTEASKSRG